MSGWTLLGLATIVLGAALGAPGLLLVGGLTLLSRWLTTLWSRYGLRHIAFERHLERSHAVWGDEIGLHVDVWNQKLLPVPLLVVDDHVTDTLRIVDRRIEHSDRPGQGVIQHAWSLLWFERVVRHLRIDARRRGVFTFGPVRLTVSDLFERGTNTEERELPARLLVRPRTVPVRDSEAAMAPLGTVRARSSLFTDPARPAGVRPYRPGDPVRRLHWRASARSVRPMARRQEPVHASEVLLAVDFQTVPGPHWLMLFDDEAVEALCVAAASIARRLLLDGAAVGIVLGTHLAGGGRWAYLAPSAAPRQLGRIEDALARVQPIMSLPFDELIAAVPRRLAPGGTTVVLSARDPLPLVPRLRRLARSGYGVRFVAFGDGRTEHHARALRAGIESRRADLLPGWRDADALVLAP